MIHRLDAWLAKHLFHPPIILVCQLTGCTQYALHRYLWWLLALISVATDDHASWSMSAFNTLFAFARTLSAGFRPDRPTSSALALRMFFWALIAMDLLLTLPGADGLGTLLYMLTALFAEYAATITTIPPREVRERKRKAADATA